MKNLNPNRKTFFLYIFILVSSNFIYGQDFKEALISKLTIAKHDTVRVKLLIDLGDKFIQTYPDTAYIYYNRALYLSKRTGNDKSKAYSLLRVGKYFEYKKKPKQSIELYLQAIEIFKSINNQIGVGDCYRYIGNSFANRSSLNTSTEYYLKALHVYERSNDKEGVGLIYDILGDLHWYRKNYNLAYDYYLKAEMIFNELGDKNNIIICFINLGNVLSDQGKNEAGKEYYYKAIKIAEEIEDYEGIATVYCNLGDVYLTSGDYKKALEYFDKSIELTKKFDYSDLNEIIYLNYSETYLKLKNYNKSIFYAEKSIKNAISLNWEDRQYDGYSFLSQAYSEQGNFKKAYENQKIYLKYADSVYKEKKFEKLASSDVLYELENQEERIETLIKNEELRSLQLSNQKLLSYILLASLMFFLILAFLLNKQRKSRKIAYGLLSIEKEKLSIEKEKAEESDRLKSAFLANMSHEIRTPMNAILGFSEILKDPELEIQKRLRFVDVIKKSGDRLMAIINDIMDISKIESDQLQLELDQVNINKTLTEIIDIHKESNQLLLKKKLELRLNLPAIDEDLYLMTDENRLTQIINNLIGNALKFTNSGYIEVGYNLKNDGDKTNIEFYVRDTGCGIKKDEFQFVFSRFSQVSENRFNEGNGLGLSICKGLMNLLGGNIWLESEIGKGTTFYFNLKY